MSEYYLLECYTTPDRWDYLEVEQHSGADQGQSWISGQRFDVTIREPIDLSWSLDSHGPRKYIYDAGIPLYHRDVCRALASAGVDNLDLYRARIADPRTGSLCEEYLAINIVGLVTAADLSKSSYVAYNNSALIDTDFDALSIEPSRASGLLMFRLAECSTGVVVHRSIKPHIEAHARNPDMIAPTFVEPRAWLG
jgi:hypothetical protein